MPFAALACSQSPAPVAGNRRPEYVVRDAPNRQPSGTGRMRRSALLPKRLRETVVRPPPTRVGTPDAWGGRHDNAAADALPLPPRLYHRHRGRGATARAGREQRAGRAASRGGGSVLDSVVEAIQEVPMTTTRTHRRPLARVLTAAALAVEALITAAGLPPQRARAQDGGAQPTLQATTADEAGAGSSWCTRIPPFYAHPPANATALTLQLLQRSVEPVLATDGLVHLPYVAQVTNTQPTPYDIFGVVPVDPLADFAPTGRNLHRRTGARPRRQGAAVRHVPGQHPAGHRPGAGAAIRAELHRARAGWELGADVLRRDLHRPGPGAPPSRSRNHVGDT